MWRGRAAFVSLQKPFGRQLVSTTNSFGRTPILSSSFLLKRDCSTSANGSLNELSKSKQKDQQEYLQLQNRNDRLKAIAFEDLAWMTKPKVEALIADILDQIKLEAIIGRALERRGAPVQGAYRNQDLEKLEEWISQLDLKKLDIEDNTVMTFVKTPKSFVDSKNSTLCVRNCHKELCSIIEEARTNNGDGALVTGNPGIGKSWFLMYLLLFYVKNGFTVIYELCSRSRAWKIQPDANKVTILELENPRNSLGEFNRWINENEAEKERGVKKIYLCDLGGSTPVQGAGAFTVVASSPKDTQYKDFLKKVGLRLIMPVWSQEEVLEAAKSNVFKNMNEDTAQKRMNVVGGVPRHIFDQQKFETAEREIDIAISKLQSTFLTPEGIDAMLISSHKLIKAVPIKEGGYQKFTIEFLSEEITSRATKWLTRQSLQQLATFLMSLSAESFYPLRAKVFEPFVWRKLSTGETKFSCMDTTKDPRSKAEDLKFPKLEQVSVPNFKDLTNLTANKLYVSAKTNEASLEAFAIVDNVLYMFQLTTQALDSNKKVKVEAVNALIALTKQKFKSAIQSHFCLVVPEDIFDTLLTGKGNVLQPASISSLLKIDGLKLSTLTLVLE
jgi:hypothetical protein